ncbi:hypothetical protein CkaCkLH20_10292 [Colletotrichum karsti]|uniref:Uncharacterized protein n=1 Tax=Colletotrichum karsti TaxID=1095194 RepID=A0A9P6I571_9PEZI|nr:uncharacterized protein CkaCkLH20_10292 [Colletotrichum karsti]KAF9872200.1 hypothetical protein CkaCkLH20_10292 [Colletotrichum karsti]
MDNHVRAFMRVIRKVDDFNELSQSFPEWEKLALSQDGDSPPINPQDRRRILDFPDPETETSNIAKSTTLSKEELLKRAVETPAQLSDTEASLVSDRYWLDITLDEKSEIGHAQGLLGGPYRISQEDFVQADERLKAMRHPLYAENEEKAIASASMERFRRYYEASQADRLRRAEEVLKKAFPWVRRLFEEDQGKRRWGYAMFEEPNLFADDQAKEDYGCRRDAVLFYACGAIGAETAAVGGMWQLQNLGWPADATANDRDEKGSAIERSETEDELAAKFQKLRKHFRSIRDQKQMQEQAVSDGPVQAQPGGLRDGMLRNVFLVDDKHSVASITKGRGFVDEMWVWAVDPDYDDPNDQPAASVTTEGAVPTETPRRYRGFMRVRLQQIVNNFYDARRFHEDEYPMSKLWEAAQKSRFEAFVSLKEDEARMSKMDRFVGSCMRSQQPRIVYGPKPTP